MRPWGTELGSAASLVHGQRVMVGRHAAEVAADERHDRSALALPVQEQEVGHDHPQRVPVPVQGPAEYTGLQNDMAQPLPAPSWATVHRVLSRNGLVRPQEQQHRRKYKRWQHERSMHLWQLDLVGGISLPTGASARCSWAPPGRWPTRGTGPVHRVSRPEGRCLPR